MSNITIPNSCDFFVVHTCCEGYGARIFFKSARMISEDLRTFLKYLSCWHASDKIWTDQNEDQYEGYEISYSGEMSGEKGNQFVDLIAALLRCKGYKQGEWD